MPGVFFLKSWISIEYYLGMKQVAEGLLEVVIKIFRKSWEIS